MLCRSKNWLHIFPKLHFGTFIEGAQVELQHFHGFQPDKKPGRQNPSGSLKIKSKSLNVSQQALSSKSSMLSLETQMQEYKEKQVDRNTDVRKRKFVFAFLV